MWVNLNKNRKFGWGFRSSICLNDVLNESECEQTGSAEEDKVLRVKFLSFGTVMVNERQLSALMFVTLWLRPPALTPGQRHEACHPKSRRGPRQPCSYVNVSACTHSWAWQISLNMQLWLQHKHLRARRVCVCVCVILVCNSDFPHGKESHDCFHLFACPHLLRRTGQWHLTAAKASRDPLRLDAPAFCLLRGN